MTFKCLAVALRERYEGHRARRLGREDMLPSLQNSVSDRRLPRTDELDNLLYHALVLLHAKLLTMAERT